MVDYVSYDPSLRDSILEFWNRTFADRPNFSPMDARRWEYQIERNPVFRPELTKLAVEGSRVVGMIQLAIRGEEECRKIQPDWPGGSQGYVAFIGVAPDRRRKGVGTRLWHEGRAALGEVSQFGVADGESNALYDGGGDGPLPWGFRRAPTLLYDDSASRKFFATRGFAPDRKVRQMRVRKDVAGKLPAGSFEADLVRVGDDFVEIAADSDKVRVYETLGFSKVADWALF